MCFYLLSCNFRFSNDFSISAIMLVHSLLKYKNIKGICSVILMQVKVNMV